MTRMHAKQMPLSCMTFVHMQAAYSMDQACSGVLRWEEGLHLTCAGGVWVLTTVKAELEATLADRFTLKVTIHLHKCHS